MNAKHAPEVRLAHGGGLRGAWLDGVRVFKGVRYAQPPFGALRFEAPVPVPGWTGVRDASSFGPVAFQWPRDPQAQDDPRGGEDALRLNIWAPDAPPGAHLPVMVWVHGGGFFRGGASDPLYDGASFARQGVVFVSIQYRLGVDGFAHLPSAPDNRGLLDQLAALQWVQAFISAWGGDPERVTVFGQSAGAGALACLMGMPASRGLFHRAILQSPSIACQSVDEATVAFRAIASVAGIEPTRLAMAAAPITGLLQAVHALASDPRLRKAHGMSARNLFPLRPVVDGRILRAEPLQAMADEWTAAPRRLQILVGSNAQEMRLYYVPTDALSRLTATDLEDFVREAGLPMPAGQESPGAALCALQSEYFYSTPARRIAELADAHLGPTYRYLFSWRSPQCGGRLGAAHGVELPFVFANLHTPMGREFAGAAAPGELAREMHEAWARFAKEGDPGWPAHTSARPWTRTFDGPSRKVASAHSQPMSPIESREAVFMSRQNTALSIEEVREALVGVLGESRVLQDPGRLEAHSGDWSEAKRVRPSLVICPRTPQEVASALAVCSRLGQQVVVQGGLTGLAGGATPCNGEIALSLARLNAMEELDEVAGTVRVQAGVVLEELQQWVEKRDWTFPLDLGARGSCHVGGNAATNAGGNRVIRFGTMRERVLGLEVALPDGRLLSMLNRVTKNTTGIDLKHLFIGSEGTLGVITRLDLKLSPKPTSSSTALCALPSFEAATQLVRDLQRALPALSAFEVMWSDYLAAATQITSLRRPFEEDHPVYVLIETLGADDLADREALERALGQALDSGLVADVIVAQSVEDSRRLWTYREAVGELLGALKPFAAFDVGIPMSRMQEFVEQVGRDLRQLFPDQKHLFFGHIGDGNLHVLSGPHSANGSLHEIEKMVYLATERAGGCISAEHGIGVVKKEFLPHSRTGEELDAMRSLKLLFDPANILNAGRVFDAA